jgi:hypothetical protein
MGRNSQVASVEVDCKRLMPLGGSLCGKTPVIHNLTTYKCDNFSVPHYVKNSEQFEYKYSLEYSRKAFLSVRGGHGDVETEGAYGTIEKSQTVAIKSKSCIPRRVHNVIVTFYQLDDNKIKLLMKYITVFF